MNCIIICGFRRRFFVALFVHLTIFEFPVKYVSLSVFPPPNTHTHTHTHIYIHTYIHTLLIYNYFYLEIFIKGSIIKTNDNETKCVQPIGLQNALDEAMDKIGGRSRCFVRPSGTENVVRIYSEAATTKQANMLAKEASNVVTRFCGKPLIQSKL